MKKINAIKSIHPGEILDEFYLKPLKLSIEKASKKIGISNSDLSAIVNKKAGITASIAKKLAKAFKTTSGYWLNMQQSYHASLIPKTKKEKLKALKMFSESDVRKRQMENANEILRLNPFPTIREVRRSQVESIVSRYMKEPTVKNTLELIQIVQENTAYKILLFVKRNNELIKLGKKVFGDDKTFLKYLFSQPRALGNKMPIEFLVDDKGAQIIIDELWRIEYGIYS